MKTILDWSDYENSGMSDAYANIPKQGGNFAKAVAVCINSKHCETKPKGVMCPSYRVSDHSSLSTGGRVKLLKAALNDVDPIAKFSDKKLQEAMELCVSYKGCKRECENEVDMAMIKIEYLAQKQKHSGASLRTRLFAYMPDILNCFALSRGMIKLQNTSTIVAKLSKRLLRISDVLELPVPVKQTFLKNSTVLYLIKSFRWKVINRSSCLSIRLHKTLSLRMHRLLLGFWKVQVIPYIYCK